LKYLLDTNAVAALMRADASAIAKLRSIARVDVAVPQPVVAEIRYGLSRLPKSKRRDSLQERWDFFANELPRAVWTDEVSFQFGEIKAALERRGERIEDFDAAIAAHALTYQATLVTSNTKHMVRIKRLSIEDWSSNPVE
jgi:tRNA(fMet)-specific endonuclease VapC